MSESYGDHLFSFFLMLGASMTQPLSLRKQLWTEKQECLKLIRLSGEHVLPWSVDRWTQPAETDVTILMAMLQCLLQNTVTQHRNPLLYEVARSQLQSLLDDSNTFDDHELIKFKSFLASERENNDKIKIILK